MTGPDRDATLPMVRSRLLVACLAGALSGCATAKAPIVTPAPSAPGGESGAVVSFVCEEDVRQAIKLNRKITIGERTIITPAARDLAEAHRVFVMQNWR